MAIDQIKVDYNADSAINAVQRLNDVLKSQASSLDNFVIKVAQFNESGRIAQVTIQQMTSEGQKLTRVLQEQGGAFEQLSVKVEQSARKQAEILKNNQLAAAAAQAQSLIQARTPALPTDIGAASTATIERLQRAQQSFTKALAFGGLQPTEVTRILDDIGRGVVKVESGPAAALQRAFLRILDTTRQINEQVAKTSSTRVASDPRISGFTAQAAATFPVPSNASIPQLAAYQSALARVQTTASAAGIDFSRLNQILAQVQSSPQAAARAFAALPPELQRAQQAILQLANASQSLNTDRLGRGLLLGLDTVARIIQTQFAHRIIGGFFSAVEQGISESTKLQVKISEIRTISQDAQISFEGLSAKVRQLSDEFGKPQADIAEGVYQAVSNQVVKGAEAFQFVAEAARFGRISLTSTADSVNLISSALKSFNLDASHAREVGDQFFKTIELGRIRGQDLANTFGRVGPAASALGISLAETNALIATISVKGITPSESLTQISALLSALTKPSKELKKLFEELGFASGQQALETVKLQGVLKLLFDQLERGPEKLGEILPNIRAIRAAFAAAADGGKDFQSNLDKILNDSAKSAEHANEIIQESAGQQLQVKFQQLKNFFVTDLGGDLTKALNFVATGLLRLVQILEQNKSALEGAAIATATYAVSVLTLSRYGGSLVAILTNMRVAVLAINPVVAAFAITIGGIAFATAEANEKFERFVQNGEALAQKLAEQRAKVNEEEIRKNEDVNKSFKNLADQAFTGAFKGLASQRAQITQLQDALVAKNKDVTNAMKLQFDSFFGSIRNELNKLKSDSTKAQTDIERSQKIIADFRSRTEEKGFERALKFEEDPTRQLLSVGNRIDVLRKQINDLFAKGDEASVEAARKRTGDLERLLELRAEKEVEIRKKTVEAGKGEGFVSTDFDPITGQVIRRIQATDIVVRLNQEIAALQRQQEGNEARLRAAREVEIQQKKSIIASEEERLRKLQQLAKEIDKVEFLTPEGDLKKQFQGRTGPQDIQKEVERLKSLQQQFIDLSGKVGDDRSALVQVLGQKVLIATNEAEAALAKARIDAANKELTDQKQRTVNLVNEANDRAAKTKDATQAAVNALQSGFIEQSEARLRLGPLGPLGGVLSTPSEQSRFIDAAGAAKAAQEQLNNVKIALATLSKDVTIPNEEFNKVLDDLEQRLIRTNRFLIQFNETRRVPGKNDEIFPDAQRQNELLQKAIEQINQLRDARNAQVDAEKAATAAQERGQATAISVAKRFGLADLPQVTTTATQAVVNSFADVDKKIDETGKNIEGIGKKIRDLNQVVEIKIKFITEKTNPPILPVNPPQPLQLPQFQGEFAEGGVLGGRGPVPVIAHGGEFIVNADSTRKFYTQLLSMNAGFAPRQYQDGGLVDVGGVNVNINEADTPRLTVREIGRELEREIRRGTISFRTK